jgi:predicted DNA-binding ribbon-helix-helix protein
VRRTQLYLDDDLWQALHARARREDTTISDLVRQAARERYLGSSTVRNSAMQAAVGIWKDRADIGDTKVYIRDLRRGVRLKRLTDK